MSVSVLAMELGLGGWYTCASDERSTGVEDLPTLTSSRCVHAVLEDFLGSSVSCSPRPG